MNTALPLKTARVNKNLTQQQLAYVADVSSITISKLENGIHQPQDSTKEKLEEILGPVDWKRTFDEGKVRRQIISN